MDEFTQKERYTYDDLLAVIRLLRAPGGCPWDREQTHASIRGAMLEECYEVIDAIDRADDEALCEELGDVLLQVAFHTVLAREEGVFDAGDVATGIVQKLIYRHPHVFGSVQADTSEQVLVNWEKLKKTEKHQTTQTEAMESVPQVFPALMRSRKVQKKAADVGFDFPDAASALGKVREETAELEQAMECGGDVGAELGDLLFSAVNVARLLHLDPEALLRETTDRFIARFADMERSAAEKGRDLSEMSPPEQDILWKNAKKSEDRAKFHN